jgi:hypothetical protein
LELSEYKNRYSGRIFIMGCGPSLNQISDEQMKRLSVEYTFGSSKFYRWGKMTPDFYLLTEQQQMNEFEERGFDKVQAKIAKFCVNWQPAPNGWVAVPHPPSLSHHHYTYPDVSMSAFEGECNHIHMTHDSPLAQIQVARYMGFNEFYLLGCETTASGYAWDNAERRKAGERLSTMLPMYEKAATEVRLYDCTSNGNLHSVLEYVALDDALRIEATV